MRKLIFCGFLAAVCWFAADSARAGDLTIPKDAVAGQPLALGTSGSGEATLYLIGPGQVIKRNIKRGGQVQIKSEELRSAGRWVAILRGGSSPESQVFWVRANAPASMSFLARPSRVAVAQRDAISATIFIFDKFHNLMMQAIPVNLSLTVNGSGSSQTVTSHDGVAWIDASSGAKEGAAQFVASVGDIKERRVVQQVAAEPCSGSLHMHVAQREQGNVIVETDPVRDCSGNPVPDGTIVTFTQTDKTGRSTVDARVKKGIARAELPASGDATISVAAGVTLGNELHVGGGE